MRRSEATDAMVFTMNARKIARLFVYLLVFTLLSCDSNAVFKDHEDIEDGQWYLKNEPTFTFEITEHKNGGLTWTVTNQRESRKETIIALLGNGVSQKTISDLMGVDKAYVSRTRTTAIKQKLLSDSGDSFTASGMLKYGGVDIEKYVS